MHFSGLNRGSFLEQMADVEFDLLVIGGGITGAGIALDAATRGMKVALVEMQDFAAGTSSRSTKLVHGGLRYLKQFEIKEVASLGKERAIVYENGPHVTTPEWMLLPFHKGGTFGKWTTSLGLMVYDYLAQVKKSERRKMLTKEETMEKVPFLRQEGLLGSGIYVEYRTDDARLTIEVMKAAHENGAVIANYAKADSFMYDESRLLTGAEVVDVLTNERYHIKAKNIVNATGPWVDHVREADGSKTEKYLRLSKGVHIVFDQSVFPLQQAVYFDALDGRMIFAIPRNGKTYVGTTDTFYDGDPAKLEVTLEDREYLLDAIHYMFPNITISRQDIESSWAGVRPLIHEEGKNPSEISRKDEIWESETGLITIAGGKLTGYRVMAETVVDLVVQRLKKENIGPCITKHLPISGGDLGGADHLSNFVNKKVTEAKKMGLTEEEGRRLAHAYGTNVDQVLACLPTQATPLPPMLHAQLLYAIHNEMAVKPIDFFFRRTGDLLFEIEVVKQWKSEVNEIMNEIYHWSEMERLQHEKELDEAIKLAQGF